jgi:acyl-CoA synthetase (AMP-forming)/AMP-acid ligase II
MSEKPMKQMPWFKEYGVFGLPKTFRPYPQKPVFWLLDEAARKYKKMGAVQLGLKMFYPQIKDEAERLANALIAMGVEKGDTVATILPTSLQFIIADYGISKAGAVHIPASFLESVDLLEHKFATGTPKVLICHDEYLDTVQVIRERLLAKHTAGLEHVIATKLEDYSANPPSSHEKIEKIEWLTDVIATHPATPPKVNFDVDRDLETLLFTGGATDFPKGCMLTHKNIVANAVQNGLILGPIGAIIKGGAAILLALPYFHVYGHCMMHTMTYLGLMQLLVPDARDTHSMVELIKEHYPIMQIGVPTQFMKLTEEKLKGIGMIAISGSAALPPETQEKFEQKSGGGMMEGYGLSELSPVTHLNQSLFLRMSGGRAQLRLMNKLLRSPGVLPVVSRGGRALGYKSRGKLLYKVIPKLMSASRKTRLTKRHEKRATIGIPFPDTEVKIIGAYSGKTLSWNEVIKKGKTGEMCLKGPQRMLGYWPEVGSGFDEEGYVHTGDVVRVDKKGYFYVVGMAKDMANISGFKVYTRELDDIIYAHPATKMAAAIGVPDIERPGSERIALFIQLRPEYKGKVTTKDFIEYLKDKVAKYAVPKYVRFVEEMPLTEVQKVDKHLLKKNANRILGLPE